MDDEQHLSLDYTDRILIKSRNSVSFQESKFGPWNTGRDSLLARTKTEPKQDRKLRKIVTESKIKLSLLKPGQKQSSRHLTPLKIAEKELEVSILLNEPKLPSIRVAGRQAQPKSQVSSFCLPVQSGWQPSTLPNMRNFTSLTSEQTKKSIMKQLNFIRRNRANTHSHKLHRKELIKSSLNEYQNSISNSSPVKYTRNLVKINVLKLEDIEVGLAGQL